MPPHQRRRDDEMLRDSVTIIYHFALSAGPAHSCALDCRAAYVTGAMMTHA